MKEISKKTKIVTFLIAIVIIAGIVITLTMGLNFELRYQEAKRIELYLEKEFEIADIKQITDEILSNQSVILQKVEVYEDTVSILAKEITEEQKTNIVNKVNEKYGTDLSADSIEITTIPQVRVRDIVKPVVWPFVIATALTLVYMAVRYHKLGIVKMILKTVFVLVVVQAILLSLIAITRIPIGRLTIPMVLVVYVLSLVAVTANFEKRLKENKNSNDIRKSKGTN